MELDNHEAVDVLRVLDLLRERELRLLQDLGLYEGVPLDGEDELEGQLFLDLGVIDLIDAPHPAFSEVLEVTDYIERGLYGSQDVVVMRKR